MKIIVKLTIVISSIILFIIGESWVIGLSALLGFLKAFVVTSFALAFLSFGIIYISEQTLDKSKPASKVNRWIAKKERAINPIYFKIYKTSKLMAILAVTLIVGPLILSIFTGMLNVQKSVRYLVAFVSSIIFSSFWVGVYSGVISLI